MKETCFITWLPLAWGWILASNAFAQVRADEELVVIDGASKMREIAINADVATTLTFESPVTVVTGYGLVSTLESVANFSPENQVTLVHFQQVADDTIVLRSLKDGKPCFVTVRTRDRIHLFKCVPAEEANLAVIVTSEDNSAANQSVEIEPETVAERRLDQDPMMLVGILSRARERKFLETVNPSLFEGWRERNDLRLESVCQDALVTVYEIQHWPERDALVFRCIVENPTPEPLAYDPTAVSVRAGDRSYPVQLADGSGRLAPHQRGALDLVLMGNSHGGKEHLSIDNDFRVEIPFSPPRPEVFVRPAPPFSDSRGSAGVVEAVK